MAEDMMHWCIFLVEIKYLILNNVFVNDNILYLIYKDEYAIRRLLNFRRY